MGTSSWSFLPWNVLSDQGKVPRLEPTSPLRTFSNIHPVTGWDGVHRELTDGQLAVPCAPVPWKWLPSMETGFGAVKVCHIFWGGTGLLNSTGTVKDHRDF